MWIQFEKEFNDRLYPQYHQDEKRIEFYHLKQGNKIVLEYETELRDLARFLPELDRAKGVIAHWFEKGLNFEIRTVMGTSMEKYFKSIVLAAVKGGKGGVGIKGTTSEEAG